MSEFEYPVLDVEDIDIMGARGEAEFNSQAKDILHDPEVKEWVEGLRTGGGNGSVSPSMYGLDH